MKHKYAVEEKSITEKGWHRMSFHTTKQGAEREMAWRIKNWPCDIIQRRVVSI